MNDNGTPVTISRSSHTETSESKDVPSSDKRAQVQALIDLMRPAVQSDGGDLVLVSIDEDSGVVEVELQGACSSCAISTSTVQMGVERILKSRLPWITEVRGGLDGSLSFEESVSLGRGGYVKSGS